MFLLYLISIKWLSSAIVEVNRTCRDILLKVSLQKEKGHIVNIQGFSVWQMDTKLISMGATGWPVSGQTHRWLRAIHVHRNIFLQCPENNELELMAITVPLAELRGWNKDTTSGDHRAMRKIKPHVMFIICMCWQRQDFLQRALKKEKLWLKWRLVRTSCRCTILKCCYHFFMKAIPPTCCCDLRNATNSY